MTVLRLFTVVLGSALLCLGLAKAVAQTDHVPAPPEFINRAAISGIYEIQAAKIALEKGQGAGLRDFAATMLEDHTKAGEELSAVAGSLSVPTALDDSHRDLIEELNAAAPQAFDEIYWRQQSDAHKDAVSLFTKFSVEGENGAVKGFAAKTLPILQHHQEMVGEMRGEATP